MYQGSGEESVLKTPVALRTCYIKSLKYHEGSFLKNSISFAEEAISNILWEIRMIVSLTSPATKLLLVRFHFVDKYLCNLIIKSPFKFLDAFCYPSKT